MTHDFLNQVSAPRAYAAFTDLIGLWDEKLRLSEGHPFAAAEDIYRATMDAVIGVMFAADPSKSATKAQLRYCADIKAIDLPKDVDKEAHIPHAPDPPVHQAILTLSESVGVAVKSPLPVLTNWVLTKLPYMRKAKSIKDNFLKEEVEKSLRKLVGKAAEDMDVDCGKDEMLRREMLLSEKEARQPLYHSRGMYDEVFIPEMQQTFHADQKPVVRLPSRGS